MKKKRLPSVLFICLLLLGINIPTHLFGQWEKELVGFGAGGSIASDTTGNIHLCCLTEPYEGDLVYAFRQEDEWIKDTLVRSGIVSQCEAVVDKDNILHVAYVEANWNTDEFTLKYMSNGGTGWSIPETVTSNDLGITAFSLDVDGEGYLHMGYIKSFGIASNGPLFYYTNRSGQWQERVISDLYEDYAYNSTSVAADDDGYAHFAFYNWGLPQGPAYQTNAPDGNWTDVISIQDNWSGGQMERMVIDIAVDSEGIPHISYVGSDDGESLENHRYATKAGAGWISEHVDDGDWYSGGHAIAVDSNGNSHMTYYHLKSEELRYAMNATGSWSYEILDTCESTEGSVDIVIDAEGFAHICYQQNPENIWYVTNHVEVPAPHITLSPEHLSFGTIDTGEVAIDSVYIKNYGVLDLHIQEVYFAGGDSAEFSIDHSCSTIAPGDSCKVRVTFAPEIIGEKQTTLIIESDDPDTPLITATINGRTPYPVIATDPDNLEFESLEVGEIDSLDLIIENNGDAELVIDSVRITNDQSDAFSYRSSCVTIAQNTSCKMKVVFEPSEPGMHTAELLIYSNDPYNPEVSVSILARTPSARLEIQTEVLDFGSVPVGNLATEQLLLQNTGERQLNISSVNISGPNVSLFHCSNKCGVISPEGSCTIDLTFQPQSVGPKSAVLEISSNDPDQPVFSVSLRGTGGELHNGSYTYGTGIEESNTYFYGLDTLSTGEILVWGKTGLMAYLAGLSTNGDILWQEAYKPDSEPGCIYAAQETWDKGYITAGSSGAKRWIARLDHNREIIWQKRVDEEYSGRINDVQVTSDSCFIACGRTIPGIPHPYDPDIWVGKFDSMGTLLWQKRMGEMIDYENAAAVLETISGDFLIAVNGMNFMENHPDGGYLLGGDIKGGFIRLDANGDLIWQKKGARSLVYNDFCLLYMNESGNALWQYTYPQPYILKWISDIDMSSPNNIYTLGSINRHDSLGSPYENMLLMKLTTSGEIIWQKEFTARKDQIGAGLIVSPHGSIVSAGSYQFDVYERDGWLTMISTDGYLDGCASGNLINSNAIRESTSQTFENSSLPVNTPPDNFIDGSMVQSEIELVKETTCTGIPTDMDYDGVDDAEESGVDGQDGEYDGNKDGLPDAQQGYVASLHTYDGTEYVTIETSAGIQLEDVSAEDNPSPDDQPEDFEFPIGFFDFTLTGTDTAGSASVTLHIPDGMAPETYYKYAPTQDNPDPHWYEFLYDGETGADIKQDRIILHFVDGARGDEDLAQNGIIKDIGGPAMQKEVIGIIQPDSLSVSKSITNYPNPFSVSTRIGFDLPEAVHVKIEIYNLLGHKIRTLINKRMAPGYHELEFRSESLPAGVYFFRIEAGAYKDTQKMILIR
ncbi:MAG: choice-of-anchor D domain-containing protein [Bacteroidales bacterium]|nr:choice-of-anchor D domain-containing protein [Bacteroidales bacterium]